MSTAFRFLLILTLLLCGRGMSVCFDGEGLAYFCAPKLLVGENPESSDDCCPCPCDEDDCEEQEVAFEPLLTESVQAPAQISTLLGPDDVADRIFGSLLLSRDWRP